MKSDLNSRESRASSGEDAFDEDDQDGPNLRTYWLMVLECKWYALAVFLVTLLGAGAYTYFTTPIYQAVVTVEILKHGAQVMRVADIVESSVTSDADFNTQIGILESRTIVENVVKQLSPDELTQLTDPYRRHSGDAPSPIGIILANRSVVPQRTSLITSIFFRHPNPKIAATVANLLAQEFIAHNSKVRIDESLKAVDELKDRADQQRRRVEEMANAMASFRQRGNLISLVQTKDIVTEKLKALNMQTTETGSKLKAAEVRWNQVQEWTQAGKDISELPFIAQEANVAQIVQQITSQKLALANLRQIYKPKHPHMVEAVNTLAEAQRQLKAALEGAADSVKAEYDNAYQNDAGAKRALSDQETASLDMDKHAVEYENLDRDFRVNEQLLEAMIGRMRETSVNSSIDTQNARIVDAATEPGAAILPRVGVNLGIGTLAGVLFAVGIAFLISVVADKVKTTFDVESVVGLPLIGVIPKTEGMEQPDKAQIVANGTDPMVVEAFLSLFSTLRLDPESRGAKHIMVTSTLPGEGKSFVSTNLAIAFASQGQHTAIVDCDLRKPNIQESFRIRGSKGVITYCTRGAPLDEVVTKNVHPNLDVIASGGRYKNPIQLFNSPEFEALVEDLGRRYDRVIYDTPPLGAVSDALNILHLMDGSIYTIRFNKVMRRAAQKFVRRLGSTDTPVFGAVMNDMKSGSAGEYYVEYHSKLVKEYDLGAEKAVAPARR